MSPTILTLNEGKCLRCQGSGRDPRAPENDCPRCGGDGRDPYAPPEPKPPPATLAATVRHGDTLDGRDVGAGAK